MEGDWITLLKSFCIKTNNEKILSYLLNDFKSNTPSNFYCSKRRFKIYNNIIYHYKGNNEEIFIDFISQILKNIIVLFYEEKIISKIINYNYFYFDDFEKKQILDLCLTNLNNMENITSQNRENIVFYLCKEYVKENKSVILNGFINFRLKEYISILDEIVESSINSYIIEKEYLEFINLLKLYINSTPSVDDVIHLIYYNNESLLLDKDKKIIKFDNDISNAKYLSDITFSSNDYCLNTLLNLLPKKLYIHLIDNNNDEFIKTLQSIFEKRVYICYNCNICKTYQFKHSIKKNN